MAAGVGPDVSNPAGAPVGPIGRAEERAVISNYLTQGTSVVLAGASGVGKTALARALRAGTAPGAPWLAATRSSRNIPFATFAPLLSRDAAATADWSVGEPLRLAQAAMRATGGEPPLLFIDDAHLLDDPSAALVHQLVAMSNAVVLLTLTSGETAPDAVTALWKDAYATRVELQPLTRAETDDLVVALLGGPCSHLASHAIWHTSEGNPLFACELVHAARAAGVLRAVDGRWNLYGALPVGARLSELIGARVDALPAEVRGTVEIVAGAEPLPLALLEQVVGLDAIGEAERQGMIDITQSASIGMVRVAHPAYGEVVRARTPKARRRAALRALVDAADAAGAQSPDDTLRYVTWRLEAGERVPVELLVDSSWRAAQALDMTLAEALARVAVDENPSHHPARLALADAQYRLRRHDDALATLAASDATGDWPRTEVAILTAKTLCSLGRADEAQTVLRDTEAGVDDPTCRAWLAGFTATLLVTLGCPRDALDLAAPLAGDSTIGPRGMLGALSALALASAFSGRREAAAAIGRAAKDPALQAGTDLRTNLTWAAPAAWVAAWTTGALDEAEIVAKALRERGTQRRLRDWVGAGSVALGWVALLRGDIVRAEQLLREGTPASDDNDDWFGAGTLGIAGVGTLAGAGLAWAAALAGEKVTGATAGRRDRPRGPRWFDACFDIGTALLFAADGNEVHTFNLLSDIATGCRARGELPYELQALHFTARLGRPRDASDRLAEIAGEMDGPYAPLCTAHARALLDDDGAALDRVSADFEAIGMLLVAAEAAAAAATAHDRACEGARFEASRRRATALLDRCPGAHPPTYTRFVTPAKLSPREAEVARLAARGLSSKAIAERLVVSVRTVDSHLAHIYAKLGVANRNELAAGLADAMPGQEHD